MDGRQQITFTKKLSFWATVCKTVRAMLSVCCLSVCLPVLSVYDIGVLCPNSWMAQDET